MTAERTQSRDSLHVALASPFDFLPCEDVRPGRYRHLSRELVARGHRVTWLTSSFSHQNKRARRMDELGSTEGIQIVSLPVQGYPSNIHPMRLVSQGQFARRAEEFLEALFQGPTPPDVLVSASPPRTCSSVAHAGCPPVWSLLDCGRDRPVA